MSVVEKIGDILIALSLIAVPVTFFLIVASESLQNYVKSSKLFTYLPGIDENRTALYIATYFAACLVFFTIILSLFKSVFIPTPEAAQSGDSTSSGTSSSQVASSDPAAQAESTSSASTDSTLNRFTIRAIETEMRSDDGYYVYVLIPPIDLAKNDYQARVENAVRGVSKSYGNKITVDVFDDEAALELQYKIWASKELTEIITPEQEALIERHQIASYVGGLATNNPSTNSMILFPNSTNKVTEVSALSRHYEFKP